MSGCKRMFSDVAGGSGVERPGLAKAVNRRGFLVLRPISIVRRSETGVVRHGRESRPSDLCVCGRSRVHSGLGLTRRWTSIEGPGARLVSPPECCDRWDMPLPMLAEGIDRLVDLSSKVLDISDAVSKSNSEAAQRVAGVLDSIVACLDRIASLARKGDRHACLGSCEEPGVYLENFARIDGLPDLAGADKVGPLNSLGSALRARKGMFIANSLVDTGQGPQTEIANILELERAAGRFRAASALVKGEAVRPKTDRKHTSQRLALAVLVAMLSIGLAYVLRR
jgi:hypothetical protein